MSGAAHLTLTTDVVPFAIHGERLEVLLARQAADWRLPGGPIAAGEELDAAARRYLAAQTGLNDVYLEQLYTFAQPKRHAGQRMVTVAYFALVSTDFPSDDGAPADRQAHWIAVNELPAQAPDGAEIVALAHRRLASKLAYSTIALQLMTEHFTLSELQAVHETILGETLDKRNFRKRILALDCIEQTGALERRRGHRPARLFRAKRPGQVDFIK
ncbi:MAG: NUDIX domain-containing protein [Candidatus Competibacteraceae bacterium]|nr:NUDIX domain-containing protein [Candidatus Competibacteraceae bacterium]